MMHTAGKHYGRGKRYVRLRYITGSDNKLDSTSFNVDKYGRPIQ